MHERDFYPGCGGFFKTLFREIAEYAAAPVTWGTIWLLLGDVIFRRRVEERKKRRIESPKRLGDKGV